MKSIIFFGLRLSFDRTKYEPLTNLSIVPPMYSSETKDYLWVFPLSKIDEVKAIIGHPFDFEDNDITKLSIHSEKMQVILSKYKSQGFVDVVEFPKIYQVKTMINKKHQTFNIDKETVKVLWSVLIKYPIGKSTSTATVAERQCEALGIDRFNRQTGTFQFDKFFGARHDYFIYLYYPLKVLQHLGLVEHHKSGGVTRLKDKWEDQGHFVNHVCDPVTYIHNTEGDELE